MEGKIILSTTQISLEDNKTMQLARDGVSRKRYFVHTAAWTRNDLQTELSVNWGKLFCIAIILIIKCFYFDFSINVTVCLKYKNQRQSLGKLSKNIKVTILDKLLKTFCTHLCKRLLADAFFSGNLSSPSLKFQWMLLGSQCGLFHSKPFFCRNAKRYFLSGAWQRSSNIWVWSSPDVFLPRKQNYILSHPASLIEEREWMVLSIFRHSILKGKFRLDSLVLAYHRLNPCRF